jgi:hypothetical protein
MNGAITQSPRGIPLTANPGTVAQSQDPEKTRSLSAGGTRVSSSSIGLVAWLQGIFLVAGLVALPQTARSVSLAWDSGAEPDIAGYKLYYGTASGNYRNEIDVGKVTTITISGLASGVTYYFATTAYDTLGLESGYSQEVSYAVPFTNPPPAIVLASPNNGASYTDPATINLTATVIANGHNITQVQFYNGANLLGVAAKAPYSLTWSYVAAGTFSVSAQIIYDAGSILVSSPASVTVANPSLVGSVNSITPSPTNVVVSGLPAPWQTGDIGVVGLTGSAGYDASTGIFTVTGSGAGISGTSDEFRFLWQAASGDQEITTRVSTVPDTNGQANAGVMIRETLDANSRFAALVRTPGNGAAFQYRNETGGGCGGAQSTGTTTPYWVRLVRTGDTFNGSISSDGLTWLPIGNAELVMAGNAYIGMCATANNNAALSTSTFSSLITVP